MIPKIIHQTYKNYNLPETFLDCQKQIKALHPDFEYRFYTDEDIDTYIKTNFPDYYEAFNELPRKIMKIDMFRYFLMYKEGGLYADMDYYMFRAFDLLDFPVVIPCNRETNGIPECLGNCIFASEAKNAFWKTLIDTLFITDRTLAFKSKDDVLSSTGPGFVYKMWLKYIHKENIYIPKRSLFHPATKIDNAYFTMLQNQNVYGIHLCTGLWLKPDTEL